MISIEDFMEDIVGKAMRGNRISIDQLSSVSNVPKDSIEELLKGKFVENIITSIAPHLNLDAGSLIASGKKNLETRGSYPKWTFNIQHTME